jgi:hypothetical protein
MPNEPTTAPAEIYMMITVLMAVFGAVAYNMVKYMPGEQQAIKLERKQARHTRSHYHKLGDR